MSSSQIFTGHAQFVVTYSRQFSAVVERVAATRQIDRFDIHYLQAEEPGQPIKLPAVKEWLGRLALSARGSTGKLGVISGADRLTSESANALLKTIEEPPAQTYLLLLGTRDNLLPTIRSRVSVFYEASTSEPTDRSLPETVSGIIKAADEWSQQKVAKTELTAILNTVRPKLRAGELTAAAVTAIHEAVINDGIGVNQKLLVEGALLGYDE